MIGTRNEVIGWLQTQPPEARFECKERKRNRTLTQNAYYWVLVNNLARTMGLSDTEIHERMLRDYGSFEFIWVRRDVPTSALPFDHFDEMGWTVTMEEGTYRQVKVYKGSSKMDSAEFSKLLDGIRWECEEQGIEVMTPAEIASLKFIGG